ncbi:MAG TPA: YcjX family protein [Azospirillaceae bacterium]|nr:YcjX family protein [Azospirillaceae bacterium]
MSIVSTIADAGSRALDGLGQLAAVVTGGDLRLGVTGLRRSGKTVFVTSLVNNLLAAGLRPGDAGHLAQLNARGRILASRLDPQPDGAVPRFDYERHLADLAAEPPRWPDPTRAVSEIRVSLRFAPSGWMRRRVQDQATLNLDIVDYPGEWLMDLPLLREDFDAWSRKTLELSRRPPRAALAAPWLEMLAATDPRAPYEEATARRLAEAYTAYLHACRSSAVGLSLLQPGRFLEPGEMAGAPVLTFCPLPPGTSPPGSLAAQMEARFEGYKEKVVRQFFREHFARLDRQIVLVDVLGALNAGAEGLEDLERSLATTLEAFNHGRPTWLSWLGGARIDKVLFAATKADHVAAAEHANLKSLTESFLAGPLNALRFSGAAVECKAIASVKCTESVTAEHEGRPLPCVKGIPEGRDRPTVLFPGAVPPDRSWIGPAEQGRFRFEPFRPPPGVGRDGRGLPTIRLDQALDFLIGDRLE